MGLRILCPVGKNIANREQDWRQTSVRHQSRKSSSKMARWLAQQSIGVKKKNSVLYPWFREITLYGRGMGGLSSGAGRAE